MISIFGLGYFYELFWGLYSSLFHFAPLLDIMPLFKG
ncbi:hypothetical protein BAZSYMA_ACONTIG195233_1 [Bathymodiolus azoricus thioautotrophic gill symbiont]|uniref:Uncharacterized protein n=1 Tax=Bathymodiolus azoricus thioautotrophic gill symbiont TaxID=235205 RepID=A0A1H6L2P6_9GAMM|nr:hypothetical protein BAZSYMA_ACONTIG195233_1 [Bathymodiolus azoricus thioautotrophic gill symbiont]